MAGAGDGVTTKFTAADVPPFGVGFDTVTLDVPAVARSAAVSDACSCVSLTNVVVRELPFHSTVDAAVNPSPFTVIVTAGLPGAALDGVIHEIAGCGLPTVTVTAGEAGIVSGLK